MKSRIVTWNARTKKSKQETLDDALAELKDKAIKHVSQSEIGDTTANYHITWTIWYEEKLKMVDVRPDV